MSLHFGFQEGQRFIALIYHIIFFSAWWKFAGMGRYWRVQWQRWGRAR